MILAIFAITLVAVALTRLPGIRIDRPAAAFAGAIAMVLAGAFTIREAAGAVDWNTIALLLGMMVIIAGVQQDGAVTHLTNAVFGGAVKSCFSGSGAPGPDGVGAPVATEGPDVEVVIRCSFLTGERVEREVEEVGPDGSWSGAVRPAGYSAQAEVKALW